MPEPTSVQPRRQPQRISFLLVVGLCVGLSVMGSSWIVVSFRPLNMLGIAYPRVLRSAHMIVPALVLVTWLVSRASALVTGLALALGLLVMIGIARWADDRPASIGLLRAQNGIEVEALESRLGFKIAETGNQEGMFFLVARENERAATGEVKRLGLYRH